MTMKQDMIQLAKDVATKAHEGQFRKDGKPYITHPEAVAKIISEFTFTSGFERYRSEMIQVAWLHDVLEDTVLTKEDLKNYGFSKSVVEAVEALSKKEGENYFDFIQRVISSSTVALFVKLADLMHNMSDLKEGSLKDKYRFARHMIEDIVEEFIR